MMRNFVPSPINSIPDPTATTGNELGKSRETRRRILEAATDCIAEHGYEDFSTTSVALRAGLTRPAMLYHFNSRLELLTAVIRYVARRRIERFEEALQELPHVESPQGKYYRAEAVRIAWNQLDENYFWAFAELSIAARTDKNLEPIVTPTLAAFDSARRGITDRTLPPESFDIANFTLARDIVRFLSEGAALQDRFIDDREVRIKSLKHFLHLLMATPAGHDFLRIVADDWRMQSGLPRNGLADGQTGQNFSGTIIDQPGK